MFFGQTANVTAEITDIAANIAEEQVDQKLRGYSSRDEIELDDEFGSSLGIRLWIPRPFPNRRRFDVFKHSFEFLILIQNTNDLVDANQLRSKGTRVMASVCTLV